MIVAVDEHRDETLRIEAEIVRVALALAAAIDQAMREPAALADGGVTPRGPGLGLAWDEAAVQRYAAA